MQQFLVDFQTFSGPLVFYAMQGDSLSRKFQLVITDGGTPWSPPAGAVWSVYFGAPGMSAGYYDTITPASGSPYPAISISDNVATVEIAAQALEIAGINQLAVVVNDPTGYQIASWSIALHIKALPGYTAPAATVYYNALSAQVAQVLQNAQAAEASATLAQSWAVGGTGTREGENTDNAQYYAQQAQSIANGQLGWFETEQALEAAHPTGQNGQWAIIGSTDTIWTWDSDTSAWVNSGSTADLSNYYTIPQANSKFIQSVNGQTGSAVNLTPAIIEAATAAQGQLAETAMQPSVYDPSDLGVNTTIQVYAHTRSGTVNNFQGTGAVGRALLTADIQAGDAFTVNGNPVTAYMGASLAAEAMDGEEWSGKWVSFIVGDEVISFSGGSGVKMDLLWENRSPSDSFAAQDIYANTQGFKYFIVLFSTLSGSLFLYIDTLVMNVQDLTTYAVFPVTGGVCSRTISVKNTGFFVSDAYTNNGTKLDNSICVPNKIYGIK